MIRIKGQSEELPSNPVISLLNTLQRHAVAIETRCGGRARCGRCVVRVVAGQEHMNPVGEAEEQRLKALKADATMRLACQSYTRGDLEIEIINP